MALKEIPRICDVEEVHLHLGLDGRLAPHFVCLAPNFQDQLLLKKKKKKNMKSYNDGQFLHRKRESPREVTFIWISIRLKILARATGTFRLGMSGVAGPKKNSAFTTLFRPIGSPATTEKVLTSFSAEESESIDALSL